MNLPLYALSPLDGRYHNKLEQLRHYFSEYALIRYRLLIEVSWLKALAHCSAINEIPPFSAHSLQTLEKIVSGFSIENAQEIKAIEEYTRHDVKALEYWFKSAVAIDEALKNASEWIHFACTSEDINNLSYALMLKNGRDEVILPMMSKLLDTLSKLASSLADTAMLARTHGQSASPTTLGKELANFHYRLSHQHHALTHFRFLGKFNGAVGNFNAHLCAYPHIDWLSLTQEFVESLGLAYNPMTTQIEPHDMLAEFFHILIRFNTALLDACRDLWAYISLGYFKQKLAENEVGSSTMPHKINPIDFENAEGNLGLANALLAHLAEKLPVSRWQRDLSDSTVMRSVGSALGYSMLAYQSFLVGLSKLEVNSKAIQNDLEQNWEVLAEAIQTVMRRHGLPEPYEQLKALTRGKQGITQASLQAFIQQLALPDGVKQDLLALTPANYIGLASSLAHKKWNKV